MSRQKGTANFSGTLEVLAGGPIDARSVVPTLADLTVASNFPYAYVGLETYVVSENKKYRLIGADVTQSSNWEEVGSGGGDIDVDDALSSTSENPVQNKVVKAALDSKVDAVNGKGLSTNDYTTGEKNKLAGLSNYDDTALRGLIAGKQDQLTAGNGIDITNNVISAGIPIVANQFEKSDLYSATEKVVGCWTDGRPIYQKVVDCGALPANTSKDVAHGISNLGLVIKGYLIAKHEAGVQISIPFVNPTSANLNIGVKVNATNIIITDASADYAVAFPTSYAILQYTKTTDAANSFNYADENDYSTTEHIVGTWIDGKPLYQKTISFTISNTATQNIPHGISNLKYGWIVSNFIPNSNDIVYSLLDSQWFKSLDISKTNIVLTKGEASHFGDVTAIVTLQYTKTTD